MATGIVAADANVAALPLLSQILFAVAAAAYAALAVGLLRTLPRPFTFGFFAVTAGGDVLGVWLLVTGHELPALALFALDLGLWLLLLHPVAARRWSLADARGEWLLLVVATQSLAALSATFARPFALAWLVLGILLYPAVAAALRTRVPALLHGVEPDDWILPGALAITALAASRCRLPNLALAAWAAALAWLPLLVLAETRALARGGIRRSGWRSWSRVFPLGMLGASTLSLARSLGSAPLHDSGLAFLALALAAWAGTVLALRPRAARSA